MHLKMASAPEADHEVCPQEKSPLSDRQKARVERNRQKALLLRQSRIINRPYPSRSDELSAKVKGPPREIDSGAGFFLEEEDESGPSGQLKVIHEPGPILAIDNLLCEDCEKEFVESFLFNKFDVLVCDNCRQTEDGDKHPLITRTDAKNKYLLKDPDFDKREPLLKFIVRKNPHNPRWGDMKLYLESQVRERALEVWGSEDKIEEEMERRTDNKEKSKKKRYDKRVKELRMAVRSSLWKKDTGSHTHEYGEETYDEEEDMYSKTCKTCDHQMSYEKM